MTIGEAVELIYRAKTKVERARRNANVHDDIVIIDGLATLVETLQTSLRESAAISSSEPRPSEIKHLRAALLNIQSLAESGFPIDATKLATRCRLALLRPPILAETATGEAK